MKIDLSTLPTTTPRATSAPAVAALAQSWSVGQLLTISVIDKIDSSTVRVAINGQPLIARSTLDLPPGSQLTAKVLTAGSQPQLLLQAPTAAESDSATVSAALGRTLPQQAPLAEVVPRIAQQLTHPASPALLGSEVAKQIDTLLKTLPSLRALVQPGALATAVRLAGNRLERSLGEAVTASATAAQTSPAPAATAPPLPEGDLKLQLIALREALLTTTRPEPTTGAPRAPGTPLPSAAAPASLLAAPDEASPMAKSTAPAVNVARSPELAVAMAMANETPGNDRAPLADDAQRSTLRATVGQAPPLPSAGALLDDVNAALARITTHQLDSANAAQNQTLLACYELPVKTPYGIQTLTVDVQDEGRKQVGSAPAALAVMVEVPVGELGKLRARIGLAGERIAITTWSDTPALRDLILAHIAELDAALAAKGFDVAPSVVRELAPTRAVHQTDHHLIDTQI